MATGGRFRDFSMLLLGTTFLVSAPVSAALYAAEPGKKPKSIARSAVPSELKARLADALRQGERELIAQAYDSTYRNPALRNTVVDYAAGLSPAASRHVVTAADLGVLTSGQRMMLAPNAAQVMATATTTASGLGASSYQNVAMTNNNNSPNLPTQLPSLAAQTWNLTMIGAQAAYTRGFTGAGVTVTVADTGFDTTNAGLVNKLLINLGKNYVVENGGTYDPNDLSPQSAKKLDIHGSHVSGIVAGEKFDNVAAHGVAYDANIIPIRAITEEGYSTVSDSTADALNYFTSLSGTMIYNASYGPNYDETLGLKQWPVSGVSSEANAALNALKAGKIIVAAAGNDRLKSPDAADNPSGLALLPFLNPAHAGLGVYDDGGEGYDYTSLQRQNGQIIAVMAVGSTRGAASYSNLCGVTASWCVAAPGGDGNTEIYSTIPYDTYGFAAGTSMATPTVSGAIAVLIQANPSYNAQDLAHLLFSTTEDLGAAGIDAVFGHGLIRLDRATEGPTTLAANAAVNVAADQTVYWSRLLNTDGEFSKIGTGILTISGRTNAAGNVYAQLGTLAVDGTLTMTTGGMLSVAQPATLAGFGTVVGDSTIAGTLSPGKMANIGDFVANNIVPAGTVLNGNSVGELTFNGNVTLTSTATTRIDIDGTLLVPGGPGTYDKIYVTGAGNVFYAAGTLTPVLRDSVGTVSNYTPALGTDFAIVQAQDGARTAGSFSSLVQPVAGLPANGRFDLVYDPTALTLVVTPASFSSFADSGQLGGNARSVAGILDSQRPAAGVLPSDREKALYDALYRLETETQYDKALTQLSGPGQPAVASASLQAFTGFLGAIGDRQETMALGGERGQNGTAQSFALSYAGQNTTSAATSSAMEAFAGIAPTDRVQDGWSVWGQGFGRNSRVRDNGDLAGSKAVSAGFTLGADRWFSNSLVAGGAFGYARTTASSTDIQGKSDTYAGAAYASWMPGAAVLDFRIVAGTSDLSTGRQIMLAPTSLQGNANGVGLGTALEAGYRFALAPDVTLKPFAGLSWQGFRRDGYSESQLPIGLVYAAQTYDKLTTVTGAALSARLRVADGATLMPELKLGWGYDLRDTTLVSQAALLDQPFLVSAAQPGRNAALVGAKISGWRTDSFRMFAAYNGEYRSNAASHQLSAGARFNW
ncbi:autotransporter domain-containing protein [Rhodopseudomonas palustris]|uniref:autotransporter domain-containing protein n=1 Tax=Rhodopseudomonas palustris TaxID=1076 RepID=UPI002ACED1D6|nr:autotransporter domain-containing protein [Rhodopseudomonas palustris]WQH00201.1 autotransporter domain-containing protein [Rhodopseudomonas palustris]